MSSKSGAGKSSAGGECSGGSSKGGVERRGSSGSKVQCHAGRVLGSPTLVMGAAVVPLQGELNAVAHLAWMLCTVMARR